MVIVRGMPVTDNAPKPQGSRGNERTAMKERIPTKAQLKKISFALFKLADATDLIYDDELWTRAVRLMGDLNKYVNTMKRKRGE